MFISKHQQNIIECTLEKSSGIHKVSALAGTGKTTTAKLLVEQYPNNIKFLILVFNASNKDEWRNWIYKSNTISASGTAHSYASFVMSALPKHQWSWVKKSNKNDYKTLLDNENSNVITQVKNIVSRFEYSLDIRITDEFCKGTLGDDCYTSSSYIQKHTRLANKLWGAMCDPSQTKFGLTESGGMKLMYMTKTHLDYDVVIWDEAQDIPDVHFAMMKKFSKNTAHILFGDDYQSINLWRDGMNGHFNNIESCAYLPQTYRFGNNLAGFANSLMMSMDNIGLKTIQIAMEGNVMKNTFTIGYNSISNINLRKHQQILFLVRANKTILSVLLKYGELIQSTHYIDSKFTSKKSDSKVFLKNLKELIGIKSSHKNYNKYPSIWYKFEDWTDIQKDYEEDSLSESQLDIVDFVVKNSGNMKTFMAIEAIIQNNDKKKPKIEFSTVHGKKGAESDVVILANDFLTMRKTSNQFEEYCIFNTAITRAKRVLYYPDTYEGTRKYQYAILKIQRAMINYKTKRI